MKLIKQSAKYWPQENIKAHIERCARVCYKSEDKINDSSALKLIGRLIGSKHYAMLEHGSVYFKIPIVEHKLDDSMNDAADALDFFENNEYTRTKRVGDYCYVTTNLRVLQECERNFDAYQSKNTAFHPKRFTIFMVTSIGISRELIRHRDFSFANESTRYCNYAKGKFGSEITCIKTHWANLNLGNYKVTNINGEDYVVGDGYLKPLIPNVGLIAAEDIYIQDLLAHEDSYIRLLGCGLKAQDARCVLPVDTKSEIAMTGFDDDWDAFLDLRLRGTTGAPHPDMVELARMVEAELTTARNRC